jgi:hypothetical protein
VRPVDRVLDFAAVSAKGGRRSGGKVSCHVTNGRAFTYFVRFECGGPDTCIDFDLNAPLDLHAAIGK